MAQSANPLIEYGKDSEEEILLRYDDCERKNLLETLEVANEPIPPGMAKFVFGGLGDVMSGDYPIERLQRIPIHDRPFSDEDMQRTLARTMVKGLQTMGAALNDREHFAMIGLSVALTRAEVVDGMVYFTFIGKIRGEEMHRMETYHRKTR